MLHERINPKDNYETPAWIWRHYIESESLQVDVHSSAINALAPTYHTLADGDSGIEQLHGARLWLNPAYGYRCAGIEPTLRLLVTAVRERGCTLVALLPTVNFGTWYWGRNRTPVHAVVLPASRLLTP